MNAINRIGQKVVCINEGRPDRPCPYPMFKKGVVYTVARFEEYEGDVFIGVRELHPRVIGQITGFRPVVEGGSDISVFTEILRKTPAPARERTDA